MLAGNLASIGVGGIIATVSSYIVSSTTDANGHKLTSSISGPTITTGRVPAQSMFALPPRGSKIGQGHRMKI